MLNIYSIVFPLILKCIIPLKIPGSHKKIKPGNQFYAAATEIEWFPYTKHYRSSFFFFCWMFYIFAYFRTKKVQIRISSRCTWIRPRRFLLITYMRNTSRTAPQNGVSHQIQADT